ncbi:NADH dehydrogenase [ubiquinone] 1 alpha subcomplex subunit 1 [Elysia marginata]|uniref:NADH dehydrogenase [ubiquinone] 1 alpha subcomplex subunit 1 n=1 Tax=Elysia marginata TaxID=1093978 RepID=A0AAV4EY23_9GAST|nr:NADH dehydrogenase [ubiquinone] 1 alpha subcomplex subunit 1 [Elysia marginata]
MWWEILPSAGIVFGALLAPHGAYWVLNKLSHNGKSCARDWRDGPHFEDYTLYLRDIRITGSEYVPRGLESIPDLKD